MLRHVTTDPVYIKHRPPFGRLSRWRFDRNRGRERRRCRVGWYR